MSLFVLHRLLGLARYNSVKQIYLVGNVCAKRPGYLATTSGADCPECPDTNNRISLHLDLARNIVSGPASLIYEGKMEKFFTLL